LQLPSKRIVSGSIDGKIKLWVFKEHKFIQQGKDLGNHDDWVRDVAWCNNIGLIHDTIASCSED
jgi:WD40 repeat protein